MRGTLVAILILFFLVTTSLLLWRKLTRNVVKVPGYLDSYWDVTKESRHSRRFEKTLKLTCSVAERPGSAYHAFSKDISGEGLSIELSEMLPEGSALDIEIAMAGDKPLKLRGQVVWVRESAKRGNGGERTFDTGIKITHIDPDAKKRLGSLLV